MSNRKQIRTQIVILCAASTLALVGVAVAALPVVNGLAVSLERSTAESTAGSAQLLTTSTVQLELTHGEETAARIGNANGVTAFVGRLDPAVPAIQRNGLHVEWMQYPAE